MASIRKRKRARGRIVWMVDYRNADGCPPLDHVPDPRAGRASSGGAGQGLGAGPSDASQPSDHLQGVRGRLADAGQARTRPLDGRGYSAILTHHLLPAFGLTKVRALHLGHIKTFLAEKREAGYSRNMLRLMRATLSVILGEAVEDGLFNINPVSQLARRRRSRPGR